MSKALGRRTVLAMGAASCAHIAFAATPTPDQWDIRLSPEQDDFVDAPAGRIWWRANGKGTRMPVLVVHGGPGETSRPTFPLGGLGTQRIVVFHDQIGCGKSDQPNDPARYGIGEAAGALLALQSKLAIPQCVVVGHGTGGWVALQYALDHPDHVGALVLIGSSASAKDLLAARKANLARLDKPAASLLRDRKRDDPAYADALAAYRREFVCRLAAAPTWLGPLLDETAANPATRMTLGDDPFRFKGKWENIDLRRRLRSIAAPTLVCVGQHDTPAASQTLAAQIKGAQLQILDGLSYHAAIEDPERVGATISAFLDRVDAKQTASGG